MAFYILDDCHQMLAIDKVEARPWTGGYTRPAHAIRDMIDPIPRPTPRTLYNAPNLVPIPTVVASAVLYSTNPVNKEWGDFYSAERPHRLRDKIVA